MAWAIDSPRGRREHFVDVAHLDSSGNPDPYTYVDTLFPEKGVHPHTLDRCDRSTMAVPQWCCPVDAIYVAGRGCSTCGDVCTLQSDAIFAGDAGIRLQAIDGGLPVGQ
jgi:hypothetical protein